MIGLIYDKLFAYGDQLQEQGRLNERKIVHNCEMLVHQAWDESNTAKSVVLDRKPASEVEELVLSIPDIKVYKDTLDKERKIYYELDDQHFDSAFEVMKYVISTRDEYRRSTQSAARKELYEYICQMIKGINFNQIRKPSGVVNVKITRQGDSK